MPATGDVLRGPNGFELHLLTTGADTGGELLVMEARYSGQGGPPPEHLHPSQDERFTVLEGSIHAVIGGVEHRYGPGETFEVPAGTPHRMASEGPARTRWEVRPALRMAEFFERLYAGPGDEDGAAWATAL